MITEQTCKEQWVKQAKELLQRTALPATVIGQGYQGYQGYY